MRRRTAASVLSTAADHSDSGRSDDETSSCVAGTGCPEFRPYLRPSIRGYHTCGQQPQSKLARRGTTAPPGSSKWRNKKATIPQTARSKAMKTFIIVVLPLLLALTIGVGSVGAQTNVAAAALHLRNGAPSTDSRSPAGTRIVATAGDETIGSTSSQEGGHFEIALRPPSGHQRTVTLTVGGHRANQTFEWISGQRQIVTLSIFAPLSAPTGLVAESPQPRVVELRWSPPPGAQYHFVAWLPDGATDLNRISIMPTPAGGQAIVPNLDAGVTYRFIVIAGRWEWTPDYGPKWSPWSQWAEATVRQEEIPKTP